MTPAVATDKEILAYRRRCFTPHCERRARLRDWKGWRWCVGCWWRQVDFEYHTLRGRVMKIWCELRGLEIY